MRNGYQIIDSHCHIYPDKIASKAAQSISDFYAGKDMRYDGSLKSLLAAGDRAGIDYFVIESVATNPAHVASINRYIEQTCAAGDGRLIPLGALHPDGDIAGDIQNIKKSGFKGVKLHADIQQIAVDDPRCFKIYEILEAEGLPVLMHAGDKRYHFSNPDNFVPVLETFKNLTVIGAHYGGWSVWDEAAEKLAHYENFYVDTSSTLGFTGVDVIKNLLTKYDTDRILYGSDYPMWDPGAELNALFNLNLGDRVYQKILSGNCKRVYGLNG